MSVTCRVRDMNGIRVIALVQCTVPCVYTSVIALTTTRKHGSIEVAFDEPHTGRTNVLNDDTLKAVIEDDNTQICVDILTTPRFLIKQPTITSTI